MAKQRSWLPAIGLALYACFWATASVAGWFTDRPFNYLTRPNWVNDLARSAARWLPPPETLLTGAAFVFLLPAIVIAAIYLSRRYEYDPLERWFERPDAERTVVVLGIALTVAVTCFVQFAIVRGAAIIDDENAYLFQARLFAHGHVGLPTPPIAFQNPMILREPMWTSGYTPGHSLVLAPAALIHAEHLVPPLFAGIMVAAIWSFCRDMFGPKHAALAALLASLSPFIWAMHGTLMAFSTSTMCLAVFLAAIARAEKTDKAWWMLLAGLAIGLAFITRPYEAVAFAFPCAIRMLGEARRHPARLAWAIAGFVAFAWMLLAHDYLVMGGVFEMPYNAPGRAQFHLGFTDSFGQYFHSPMQAIGTLVGVVERLDLWTLAWPGSLILVIAGCVRRRPARGDWVLRWTLGSFVAFYILVPFPGTWDVGPTYYYAIVPVLIPLAVRGVSSLRAWLTPIDARAGRMVGWVVIAGMVVAVTVIAPIRAINLAALSAEIRAPWDVIEGSDLEDSIVIVPPADARKAPGWAFGYPYTLTTKRGATVHLILPGTQKQFAEAVNFLGQLPVYQLVFDSQQFAETGTRAFSLVPLK
ncbi:MAG: glycosyltransferase family 39 protein [Kofleriaceae bacterium]